MLPNVVTFSKVKTMKAKILILILSSSLMTVAFGQELKLGNFTYDTGSLIWQKVYESGLSIEEMKSKVKSLPIIDEVISEDENLLTIDCKRIDHNWRALGGTKMNTSFYISNKSSIGNVVFQLKEGRYRVTFTNPILEQEITVEAGILSDKEGDQSPLAEWALKMNRSNWRGYFKNKDHKILDYSYSEAFDLSSSSSSTLDDDF